MSNNDVRLLARGKGVPLYAVAKRMGISEPTFFRKLRDELPKCEKKRIREIIVQISKERGGAEWKS